MTFDNRPVRRTDDRAQAPRKTAGTSAVKRTTSSAQSGVKRTSSAAQGTTRTNGTSASSRTARPNGTSSAAPRRAGATLAQRTAQGTTRRPANQSARRSAPKKTASRKPAWLRERVGRFDVETLLAMALILVVLVAVGFVTVKIVQGISQKNTTVEPKYDIANIKSEAEVASALNNNAGSSTNTNNGDFFGVNTGSNTASNNNNASGNTANNPSNDTTNTNTTVTQPAATTNANNGVPRTNLRSATIRTVGDFVVDKNMLSSAKSYASNNGSSLKYDFSGMLSVIGEYMGKADFTVANVDGSMGGKYKHGYTGYPQINTPEMLIQNLKDVGVDMLTLANNHMLDGWYDGLLAELDNVDAVGLYHVGAYRTQEERDKPCIVEINGIKVGFLNYTESLNNFENYGVDKKALEFGCGWIKNSNCTEDAKKLRQAGAEVIVCFMHWGEEYSTVVNKSQTDQAQKLMKAGVDVIVGGHPHVVQHAEWITGTNQFGEAQRTFCIYSLGNYLTEHTIKNTDGGLIFDFTIQEKGDGTFEITAPSYITTYVWKCPNDLFGRDFVVVPCAMYINNKTRPSGMSDSEYQAMVASHNNQVAIMNEGVGQQKTY